MATGRDSSRCETRAPDRLLLNYAMRRIPCALIPIKPAPDMARNELKVLQSQGWVSTGRAGSWCTT